MLSVGKLKLCHVLHKSFDALTFNAVKWRLMYDGADDDRAWCMFGVCLYILGNMRFMNYNVVKG